MSAGARESHDGGGAVLPVVGQGTITNLTTEASGTIAYIAIGATPDVDTTTTRIPITPNSAEYFAVTPGVDKVAAKVGSTSATTALMEDHTTVVRVFYDSVAGVVSVMQGRK